MEKQVWAPPKGFQVYLRQEEASQPPPAPAPHLPAIAPYLRVKCSRLGLEEGGWGQVEHNAEHLPWQGPVWQADHQVAVSLCSCRALLRQRRNRLMLPMRSSGCWSGAFVARAPAPGPAPRQVPTPTRSIGGMKCVVELGLLTLPVASGSSPSGDLRRALGDAAGEANQARGSSARTRQVARPPLRRQELLTSRRRGRGVRKGAGQPLGGRRGSIPVAAGHVEQHLGHGLRAGTGVWTMKARTFQLTVRRSGMSKCWRTAAGAPGPPPGWC